MKFFKKLVASILNSRGLVLLKKYEIEHYKFKYGESIEELIRVFNQYITRLPEGNKKRKYFLSHLFGTQISEALYIIYYLSLTKKIKGDVCEFGCANGATSALIANEILDTNKSLWLFDSFEGLSEPTKEDKLIDDMFNLGSIRKYKGTMSYKVEEVIRRVSKSNFPKKRLKIVPGFIDQSIKRTNLPQKISFSFIDFDLYAPIKTSLEYHHGRLAKNGYIIIDDYEFFSSGVKKAVSEFLELHKKEYELILPEKFAGHFCILKGK